MTRRLILIALVTFAMSCATRPAPTPATDTAGGTADKAPSGNRYGAEGLDTPVGVIPDIALPDPTRNRTVILNIDYPTAAGSYPVIIWSHGFGGSGRGYVALASQWARSGYVVIRPSHADAGRLANVAQARDAFESQTQSDWAGRVRDIVLVLDSLDRLEADYPELKGKIDRTKVGVGGHSYGAFTAMLLGGARTFPGGTSYADPRVKAIVAFSPQGPNTRLGLTDESFATINVPALFVTGSNDQGLNETEHPVWRRQAYVLSPAGDKWFLLIEGAQHMTFAGRYGELAESRQEVPVTVMDSRGRVTSQRQGVATGQSPQHSLFIRARNLALGFWDTYLRGDAEGRKYIESVSNIERK